MHATNSLRLGASLRLSRPLQDQTLHAAHGRAARVGNSAGGNSDPQRRKPSQVIK